MGSSPAQDSNFFRQKKCNCHCHLKTKEPVHVEVETCVEILPNASVITCQCRGSLYLCFYEHISCQVLFIHLCLLFVLGNLLEIIYFAFHPSLYVLLYSLLAFCYFILLIG